MEHFCIYLKVRGQRKQPDVCQAARCWGVQLGLQAKMKVTIKPLYSFPVTVQVRGERERHWLLPHHVMAPGRDQWKNRWGDKSHCQGGNWTKSSCFFNGPVNGYRKKRKELGVKSTESKWKTAQPKEVPGLSEGLGKHLSQGGLVV